MSEFSVLRPQLLPLLPLREEVVFPATTIPFFVGRKPSMEALDKALATDRRIFVITQKNSSAETPGEQDLFRIGTIGKVLQIMRLPNGTVKALFEATHRARILETQLDEGLYLARVETIVDQISDKERFEQLVQNTWNALEKYQEYGKKKIPEKKIESLQRVEPILLADCIVPLLETSREQKRDLLECLDIHERLESICRILEDEFEVSKLESRLKNQAKEQIRGSQKEDYLQDQLHSIQKELGQIDEFRTEIEELSQRIKEAKMSKEAEELALKELKKLKLMSPMSAESNVVRNYLEWLVSMPWQNRTKDNFDLDIAQKRLDEDHYGLEKVKQRIIEYIAVAHLKGTLKGPILCLVGPPGVGKTSLAKSVARALDRQFVRMSLGGIRDEAEIRGHRRTYIGALPGKIIQSIRKGKTTIRFC